MRESEIDMDKYPMKTKTDKPLFDYLVRDDMKLDYYLFKYVNEAFDQAEAMCASGSKRVLIYESCVDSETKEWHGRNAYDAIEGKVKLNINAKAELHLETYVNAGRWLNPNQEWIDILTNNLKRDNNIMNNNIMIKTNMGEIPYEDYLEIKAMQSGFDSYEDMRNNGYYIDLDIAAYQNNETIGQWKEEINKEKARSNEMSSSSDRGIQKSTVKMER